MTEPIEQALRLAEALIFASADPVPTRQLATLLGPDAPGRRRSPRHPGRAHRHPRCEPHRNRRRLDVPHRPGSGPGAGTYRRKAPDASRAPPWRLSPSSAYHQPCTRADIEDRRGVALAPATLELLLETGLIAPAGHRETPGRPALWVTSNEFLIRFGLKTLADLPKRDDITAGSPAIASPDRNSAPLEPVLNAPIMKSDPPARSRRGRKEKKCLTLAGPRSR